jgi:hypothetical protein
VGFILFPMTGAQASLLALSVKREDASFNAQLTKVNDYLRAHALIASRMLALQSIVELLFIQQDRIPKSELFQTR